MTDVKSHMARARRELIELVGAALDAEDVEACNSALAALVSINESAKAKGWDLGRHVCGGCGASENVVWLDAKRRLTDAPGDGIL